MVGCVGALQMNHNEDCYVSNKGPGGLHEQMRNNEKEKHDKSKDLESRRQGALRKFQ